MKRLLIFLLLASPAMAQKWDRYPLFHAAGGQTHTFPALDTSNSFTNGNAFTNAGVFNNGQTNQLFTAVVGSINVATEWAAFGGSHSTEGFTAGLGIPSNSTVFQGDGLAYYLTNTSTTTFGVGLYGQARCTINNCTIWSANTVVGDSGGLTTGLSYIGYELDVGTNSPTSAYTGVFGYTAAIAGNGSTGFVGGSTAFFASGNAPNKSWNYGFATANARAQTAFVSGATCTSLTCNSQGIQFVSLKSSLPVVSGVNGDSNGNVIISPAAGANVQLPQVYTNEQVAPGAIGAGADQLWGDSTAHRWKMINNNGSPKTVAALESDTFTSPTFSTGVSNNGSGFKHIRFAGNLGGTCPTGGAAGNACTSGNINWTTPFADNNYTVTCTLNGAMTGQPHIVSTTYQAAGAGITITIAADTAVAANVAPTGFTDCIAVHD